MFTSAQARKTLHGFIVSLLMVLPFSGYAEDSLTDLKSKILDEFRSGIAPENNAQPVSAEIPATPRSGEAGIEDIPELENKILEALQGAENKPEAAKPFTEIKPEPEFKSVVPSLLGKTEEQAKKILEKSTLRLGTVAKKESDKNAGIIIEQSHSANVKVNQFSVINVVTASGSKENVSEKKDAAPKTDVADSEKESSKVKYSVRLLLDKKKVKTGESFALEAIVTPKPEEKLEYSFTINRKVFPSDGSTLTHSIKEEGRIYIIASVRRPRQGWIPSTSSALVIEKGGSADTDASSDTEVDNNESDAKDDASLVEVPNVVNMSMSQALVRLKAKGFKLGSVATKEREGKERVLAQKPKAKKKVKKGSAVDLVKSKESDVVKVVVPSVVGLTLKEAEKVLKEAKLQVGIVGEKGALGKQRILEQVPVANVSMPEGSKVNLINAMEFKISFSLSADKAEINVSESVAFQGLLQPSENELGAKVNYRLFIDETKLESESSAWKYVFNESGSYEVIAEADIDGAGVFRSKPIAVKVNTVWQEPKALIDPPTLVVTQGDSATFTSLSTHDENSDLESYWLDESGHSGNGETYQISTQTWSPGEYWVSLRVKDNQGFESSDKAQLIVMAKGEVYVPPEGKKSEPVKDKAAEKFSLSISTPDHHVAVDKRVTFTVEQQPASKEMKRIVFGDGGDAYTSAMSSEHRFTAFGRYSVYVETSHQNKMVKSESISIWVWPSWLLIGGVGLGLLVLVGLFKLFRPRIKKLMKTRTSHVNYVPSTDSGEQRLDAEKTSENNTKELSMKTEVDEGQQRMLPDNKK